MCPLLLECVHAAELAPLAKRRLPQKFGGVLLTRNGWSNKEKGERGEEREERLYIEICVQIRGETRPAVFY